MFPLGQLSESRAVYRGPEISTWHCDKTKAFEILVNYSQTYFFVCRSHCSVQNFCNFCCFWDIENCISAWPSIGDNFWPAVTFFFLLFEHWKYQIRWVQGLNFQIGLYPANRVRVYKVLQQSIHYTLLWTTTWRFLRYLLCLIYYISISIPTSMIQGCWFQLWYLLFLIPCSFQLINTQSFYKIIYTGQSLKVFSPLSFMLRTSFFFHNDCFLLNFLPYHYFFSFLWHFSSHLGFSK